MTTTNWNDDEDMLLQGLPWLPQVIYLRVLRRYMNYRTGIVGRPPRRISYQSIAEVAYVEPDPGRHKDKYGSPTMSAVREALAAIAKTGLIKRIPPEEFLVFLLPKALSDRTVQNRNSRGTAGEQQGGTAGERQSKTAVNSTQPVTLADIGTADHLIPNALRNSTPPLSVVRKEKESINTHVDSNKNPAICVFNYWKQAMHKDSRCKPDIKRLDAITARLRDGFSVEELHEAVHGNLLSAWHQGKNEDGRKFDDIGLICRDSQQTLKFIEIARAQTKKKATVDERWEFLEPDVIEGECSHGKCVGL